MIREPFKRRKINWKQVLVCGIFALVGLIAGLLLAHWIAVDMSFFGATLITANDTLGIWVGLPILLTAGGYSIGGLFYLYIL